MTNDELREPDEPLPAVDGRATGVTSRSAVELVDTHCHLDYHKLAPEIDDIVARAIAAGVSRMIIPALDLDSVRAALTLADRFEAIYAAVGVHPNSAAGWQDEWIDELRASARREKVVAIGEIGLDYYWDKTTPEIQHRAFTRQLELAGDLNLPVIVHNREASADTLRFLADSPLAGRERAGVLHSFAGDWAFAKQLLDLGFYIGFTGPLTYKKANELRDVAGRVPLDRILIETDSPYQTPEPHRGQRNEPAYVRLVAERLAEVRGRPLEEIAAITTANAERLFRLSTTDHGRQTTGRLMTD
jgi:TatD DNase family protein